MQSVPVLTARGRENRGLKPLTHTVPQHYYPISVYNLLFATLFNYLSDPIAIKNWHSKKSLHFPHLLFLSLSLSFFKQAANLNNFTIAQFIIINHINQLVIDSNISKHAPINIMLN